MAKTCPGPQWGPGNDSYRFCRWGGEPLRAHARVFSRRDSVRRGLLSARSRPARHGLAARVVLRTAAEQPAEDRSFAVVARVGIVLRQARRPVGGVGFAVLDRDVGPPVLVALHAREVTGVPAVDVAADHQLAGIATINALGRDVDRGRAL